MFVVEVPLTVTFERTGVGDDDKSVQRIERARGVAQVFLKAKSSANGQYYKEAFGVEEFRFNACANDDALRVAVDACNSQPLADGTVPPQAGEDAPGFGVVAAFGALAAVAVALRRRRA
jgi:MYXO-CTERM domain-containing protein